MRLNTEGMFLQLSSVINVDAHGKGAFKYQLIIKAGNKLMKSKILCPLK
jgi:hypothetical protein